MRSFYLGIIMLINKQKHKPPNENPVFVGPLFVDPLIVGPLFEKNGACSLLGFPLFVGPLFVCALFICPLLENDENPLLENWDPLFENIDPLFGDYPKKPNYKHQQSVIGYYCSGGTSGSNFFQFHGICDKMAKLIGFFTQFEL